MNYANVLCGFIPSPIEITLIFIPFPARNRLKFIPFPVIKRIDLFIKDRQLIEVFVEPIRALFWEVK